MMIEVSRPPEYASTTFFAIDNSFFNLCWCELCIQEPRPKGRFYSTLFSRAKALGFHLIAVLGAYCSRFSAIRLLYPTDSGDAAGEQKHQCVLCVHAIFGLV